MRWNTSKIISLLVALGLIALGMWMIFVATGGTAPPPTAPASINAPETANPGFLGFAMLCGGVLIIFMTFRRI